MDALAKLLKRVSPAERLILLVTLRELKDPKARNMLDIKKLSGGEYYRARKGVFRIIFHFESDGVAIDAIRFRSERTYRDIK